MVRWTTVDVPPKPPITVRASVIGPEHGLIKEVAIAANRLALLSLLGGGIRSYLGNDYVLLPVSRPEASWCWRKDDMTFAYGCVIVGHRLFGGGCDLHTELAEQHCLSRPGGSYWTAARTVRQGEKPE